LPPSLIAQCRPYAIKPSTSLELSRLSAFAAQSTLLFTPCLQEASGKQCPVSQKSHTQGLATLSVVSAHSEPRKPLSVPNALRLRPSKPCSFLMIRSPSRMTLSVHALSYKTLSDLIPALQRLTPTRKAVLLLPLPRGLVWAGASCSLGLYDLLGSLRSLTHEASFSLTSSPSRP
jgi:hypothetical protein